MHYYQILFCFEHMEGTEMGQVTVNTMTLSPWLGAAGIIILCHIWSLLPILIFISVAFPLGRVFSDISVAFPYFDICH